LLTRCWEPAVEFWSSHMSPFYFTVLGNGCPDSEHRSSVWIPNVIESTSQDSVFGIRT
jgi:hypothetical protein